VPIATAALDQQAGGDYTYLGKPKS
jgi:hypothetical protein